MVNGAVDLAPGARNLALQRDDAHLQFGDGQAIEILAQQRGQRIVGARPKDVVQVHARIVDAQPGEVNKAGASRTGALRPT